MEIHLQDGRILSERADRVTQGALRGVSMQEIQSKFQDTSSRVLAQRATEELLGLLDELEDSHDISRVADLLRG